MPATRPQDISFAIPVRGLFRKREVVVGFGLYGIFDTTIEACIRSTENGRNKAAAMRSLEAVLVRAGLWPADAAEPPVALDAVGPWGGNHRLHPDFLALLTAPTAHQTIALRRMPELRHAAAS